MEKRRIFESKPEACDELRTQTGKHRQRFADLVLSKWQSDGKDKLNRMMSKKKVCFGSKVRLNKHTQGQCDVEFIYKLHVQVETDQSRRKINIPSDRIGLIKLSNDENVDQQLMKRLNNEINRIE